MVDLNLLIVYKALLVTVSSHWMFGNILLWFSQVFKDEHVKLKTSVSGFPIPEVQWYFNGKPLNETRYI